MSDLKVEIAEITKIEKHPNADRLDICYINDYDWSIVTGREAVQTPLQFDLFSPAAAIAAQQIEYVSKYKSGDLVIYIPIDSILPTKLESYLFPPDSKIQLSKSRIRTIKLRKVISQGMIVDLNPELLSMYPRLKKSKLGDDITEILGITKYEPPVKETPANMKAQPKKFQNEFFKQYTDIQNFKYYPHSFEGKEVNVTEKIHGTSARYAILKKNPHGIWEHILNFFHMLPEFEYCFGSRRVQLQEKPKDWKGFYDNNVYAIISKNLTLDKVLLPGESLYGEIVGHGIQAGYSYGCAEGEYRFFAYDVKVSGKYLDYPQFKEWCDSRGIERVPILYEGIFDHEKIDKMRSGDSLVGNQKCREGVVVRTQLEEFNPEIGRALLKWINDEYLLKADNTDFH